MDYDDATNDLFELLKLPQTVTNSVGVFTHADGRYAVIIVSSGTISAAGITVSAEGEQLRTLYLDTYQTPSVRQITIGNTDAQLKHEGYVLGQSESYSTPIEIGTYSAVGIPLHYGWNFNWSGTEATCVTHEPVFSGPDLVHYISRTYVLTVSEDQFGILTASVTQESTSTWEPKLAETFIWKPQDDLGSSAVEMWYPYGCGTPHPVVDGYGDGACQADVYAYYKADGQRVLVEYFRKEKDLTTTLSDLEQESYEALCADYGFYDTGPGVLSGEYKGYLGKQEFGFIVDGVEYSTFNSDGGLYREIILTRTLQEQCIADTTSTTISQALLEAGTDYDWPIPDYSCTYPEYAEGCRHELKGHYFHLEVTEGSGDTYALIGKAALVLPTRSCETVYVSTLENVSPSFNHSITEGEGMGEVRRIGSIFSPNPGVPSSPWVGWNSPCTTSGINCNTGIPDIVYAYGFNCWPTPPALTLQDVLSPASWDIKLYIHSGFEDALIESYQTGDYNALGGYTQLFYPALCIEIPIFAGFMNMSSTFGNSLRMESVQARELGSNCSVDADLIRPYGGLWLGRS